MDLFQTYLQSYWGITLFVICFIVYLVMQGKAKAGQIILSLMLRAEKEAEALLLQSGDQKFAFVVDKGYQLLPKMVRMFITYTMFEDMAKSLYASAKNYLLGLHGADPKTAEIQESKITDPG